MNLIINNLIFIGQSIYTTLPGIFANMAPIIFKNVPFLNYPIDFYIMINGKPMLGKNKTFRGLFFGIIIAMIVLYIQYFIYKFFGFKNLSLIDYDKINYHLFGFLAGFGVIFGDIFKSFIKRRLDIPPSKKFVPWDQIDCALGGLLFIRIVWAYSLRYAITIILLTFIIHISIRHLAFYLKITDSKW